MIRFALPFVITAAALLTTARVDAQCAPFGTPCVGGSQLLCLNSSPPQIGASWQICDRAGCGGALPGNPATMFTLFGGCTSPGLPILPPLACASCPSCEWQSLPSVGDIQWLWPNPALSRCTAVTIPNEQRLIGVTFCIQNACVGPNANCVCLSNVLQVTIMP